MLTPLAFGAKNVQDTPTGGFLLHCFSFDHILVVHLSKFSISFIMYNVPRLPHRTVPSHNLASADLNGTGTEPLAVSTHKLYNHQTTFLSFNKSNWPNEISYFWQSLAVYGSSLQTVSCKNSSSKNFAVNIYRKFEGKLFKY